MVAKIRGHLLENDLQTPRMKNEKKNPIFFSSYDENSSKINQILEYKMAITRKIKIGKIYNLIFRSFQNIPHI